MKQTEELYRDVVTKEIEQGASCEDVIKKYPVSMYYARKWTGDVFRKRDMGHYVRDRYKWLVLDACADIENSVVQLVGNCADIDESLWDHCFNGLRVRLYGLLEEVVKKN